MLGQSFDKNLNQQFITAIIQKFTSGEADVFTYLTFFVDLVIVLFILIKAITMLKRTRAWQLFKGIMIIIFIRNYYQMMNQTTINMIMEGILIISFVL